MADDNKSDTKSETKSEAKVDRKNDSRNLKPLTDDKAEASGQSALNVGPNDQRDQKEQAEHLAREAEAEVYADDQAAGDRYLFPKLPVSAQNPPVRAIIAYKDEASEESQS